MKTAVRLLVSGTCFVAAFYWPFWTVFSPMFGEAAGWMSIVAAIPVASGVSWYVWRETAAVPTSLVRLSALGSVVFGATGFVAGFFGPMVFTPQSNQGPLLGLIVTGPVGAIAGAIGGFGTWAVRRGSRPWRSVGRDAAQRGDEADEAFGGTRPPERERRG